MPEFSPDKNDKQLQFLLEKVERMLNEDGLIYFMQEEELYDVYQYYQNLEDEFRASKLIDIALQVHPLSEDFLLEKISMLIAQNRFEEAEETVDTALLHFPNDYNFLKEKLEIAIHRNTVDACIPILEKAAYADTENFPILHLLGYGYGDLGQFEKAIHATLDAIEQYDKWRKGAESMEEYQEEPDLPYEHLFYGGASDLVADLSIYTDEEKCREICIGRLESMIDEAPYDVEKWLRLGLFHKNHKNFSEAIKCLEYGQAANLNDSDEYFDLSFILGECLLKEKRTEDALQVFGELWEKGSRNADTAYFNGVCLEELGGYDKAIRFYQKALDFGVEMPQANLRLGTCLIKQEKWLEATHFLNLAADFLPDEEQYDALIALAEAEYQLGNYASATDAFEEASTVGAEHTSLWLKWSHIYYEQGALEEAIEIILEGIEELPDDPELMYRATAYFLAAGKPVQATEYLQFALVIDYEKHHVLFEFFQDIAMQKTLAKLINRFKD